MTSDGLTKGRPGALTKGGSGSRKKDNAKGVKIRATTQRLF